MNTKTVVKRVGIAFVLCMIAAMMFIVGVGLHLFADGWFIAGTAPTVHWWILKGMSLMAFFLTGLLLHAAYRAARGRFPTLTDEVASEQGQRG